MTHRLSSLVLLSSLGLAAAACAPVAPGEVTVTAYGEEFIELGIPAEEMADGWAVEFDRFIVTIEDVTVAGVTMPAGDPIDIAPETDGAGHVVATAEVPGGDHADSSFSITRVELAGSASKDGTSKTFDWSFDAATDYFACETVTTLNGGESATFQITVRADHFFYDSLVAEDPQVVFEPLAQADADDDGEITRAELEATDIGSYDPGSAGDVNDLWAWLIAQSRTLGHVDGEGHCDFAAASG